jgi:very-short-patch-repair endonuclease
VDLRRIDNRSRTQHGLITRKQALSAGISSATWYRMIEAGLLEQVHPNVARLYGAAPTLHQRALAAVLAAGATTVASHRTAAALWDLPGFDADQAVPPPPDDDPDVDPVVVPPVHVIVTSRTRGLNLAAVAVHRPTDHRDLTAIRRDGVPTTNILRTLCDIGVHEPSCVPGAVGHVLTTRLASPAALHRAVHTHGRRGRPGVPALRDALDEWVIDGKPPDSVLEPAVARLIRTHRLPPAEFHARILGYEVDFLVRDSCVVLECDGWAVHALNRPKWEQDKIRDAELSAAGHVVVRFTYRQVTNAPRKLAERIRAVVARWSPAVLGAAVLSS